MALTNKLSNIATAIRDKTGSTELMTLDEMPTAIAGISGGGSGGECTKHHIPDECLVISGSCQYRFANGCWDWFIEECGNEITSKDITSCYYMFNGIGLSEIPFDINLKSGVNVYVSYMFQSSKITKPPYIKGKIYELQCIFQNCYYLKEIPEDWADYIDFSHAQTFAYASMSTMLYGCYSLRRIPDSLLSNLYNSATSSYNKFYGDGISNCYALDEINGIPVDKTVQTSNMLGSFCGGCTRLKNITFATNEDGSPQTASWKNQTFNVSTRVGWASRDYSITDYSAYHGITTATKVTDDASYQALKDNPDWWTTDEAYSRYSHDSAVRTIASLPDTSAYLASAGGTNTIKFKGAAGSATDGGAINTLTPEEISIAAAKGWTVTLV